MSGSHISWVDYLVLALLFAVSILTGFYHGFRERIYRFLNRKKVDKTNDDDQNDPNENEKNTKNKTHDYLTANSSIGTIPVAFSLLATVYSATTLLGVPVEVYQYGLQHWLVAWGQMVCPLLAAFMVGPFFARLKVFTIFEYFEMRFQSRKVRLVGTYCYIIKTSITSINLNLNNTILISKSSSN